MTTDLVPPSGTTLVVNEPLCRLCRTRSATACRFCGDDFDAFVRMFRTGQAAGHKQGVQDAHFATYADNLAATAAREAAERARQDLQRWHE